MDPQILVERGEEIGYALVGALALLGFVIVQLVRRGRDLSRARTAVRLASLSISEPRPGPIAVTGTYHESTTQRWLECSGQRVAIAGAVEIARGTRARWRGGERTYTIRPNDMVVAIGVMAKQGGWQLAPSPGETGVQLFATRPRAAPPPLFPWRAPLILAVCAGVGFGALYGTGTVLVDTSRTTCDEGAVLRMQLAAAVPVVREQALAGLERCR